MKPAGVYGETTRATRVRHCAGALGEGAGAESLRTWARETGGMRAAYD